MPVCGPKCGRKCRILHQRNEIPILLLIRAKYAQLNVVQYSDDVGSDVCAMGDTGEYWIVVDCHNQNAE